MKKFINTILMIVFLLAIPFNIYANPKDDNQNIAIIADKMINKETNNSQNSTTVTYKNIENFVNYIKENSKDISEIDLAKFIMDYTNQEYDFLTEEIILQTLNYKEITVSTSYFKASNDGTLSYISKNSAEPITIKAP